jgi:hypothetical protein
MSGLNALLATEPSFLLHKHLAGAKEAQLLCDQRSLITTRAGQSTADAPGILRNHANLEISGLVSGLNTERWTAYGNRPAEQTAGLSIGEKLSR